VRVIIKGKLLQLPLPEEVSPDLGTARRSTLTGNLVLTLPKVKQVLSKKSNSTSSTKEVPSLSKRGETSASASDKNGSDESRLTGTVDIRNIVKSTEEMKVKTKEKEKTVEPAQAKRKSEEKGVYDFDESEVPPLE
jgi:hypothetical protein